MIFATHIYLMAGSLFFALWLTLFLFTPMRKRREMVLISLLTMVLGFFVQQMHLTDWWQPRFLFNTPIKIEDMLFGFSIGGIVYAFYEIFCKILHTKIHRTFSLAQKALLMTVSLSSLFALFYVLHVHSFWTSIISLSIPLLIVVRYDYQTLPPIVLTGLTVTVIALCGYLFSIHINPDFVAETYLANQLSGVFVFGIPIEELIWFFFAGTGGASFLTILNTQK